MAESDGRSKTLAKYTAFKEKSFLIVDDFQEFRTAIKRMVEAFGAVDIETSSSGEDAIDKMNERSFDVVLCDYNLGKGKDGQQVLEEGKYSGLLDESKIFIVLTAENNADMVMGALEYEPDTYLVKPFNKDMLYERLNKCLEQKKALIEIYQSLEGSEPKEAIKICDKIIASGGKYVLPCIKIKGRELIKLKEYKEAIKIYKRLLEARSLPWALLGLGKVYFYQNEYDKSKKQFELLLEENEYCVEAIDWISKIYETQGDKILAQDELVKSSELSPKAIMRQQHLADLAWENKNYKVAEKAYKAATELGRHSCYRRDKDFYQYSIILYKMSNEEGNPTIQARLEKEAEEQIQHILNYKAKNKGSFLEPYAFLLDKQIEFGNMNQAAKTLSKLMGLLNSKTEITEYIKSILIHLVDNLSTVEDPVFVNCKNKIQEILDRK